MSKVYRSWLWKTAAGRADRLRYCFPGREFVLSGEDCDFRCEYGFMWPVPFVTVLEENQGTTLIADSESVLGIRIRKQGESLAVIFELRDDVNPAGEVISVSVHESDFMSGIREYQRYDRDRRGTFPEMPAALQHCFRVRRRFFYPDFCRASVFDKEGNVKLAELHRVDQAEIGGTDAELLFDYAYNPETKLRCGNRQPSAFSADAAEQIREQMTQAKEHGVQLFFVYFDPYLIQEGSPWDTDLKEELEIRDAAGHPCRVWGEEHWHPCIAQKLWQQTSLSFLADALELLQPDGIYLDEFGNGTQYACSRRDHTHGKQVQIPAERQYAEAVRNRFPDQLLMCEFAPVDLMVRDFPIVLSDTRTVLNIYRFIFPQIRFVRIIGCDLPLGDNIYGVNKSFFNGEGLWIDNDVCDPEWYPSGIKAVIKAQYEVLQEYSDCFSSADAEPLVKIQSENGAILANRFSGPARTVYTFLNTSDQPAKAALQIKDGTCVRRILGSRDMRISEDIVCLELEAFGTAACCAADQRSDRKLTSN